MAGCTLRSSKKAAAFGSAAHEVGPTQVIATYRDYLGYRLFETSGLQQAHRQWVEIAVRDELSARDARWSEAVAVGSLNFVEKMKSEKKGSAHRELIS
jgi:hypothetical protein